MVVKVITQGKLADGYRLTNVSVNPPTVTVYSSDPNKVEALPGYVETTPINLDKPEDRTLTFRWISTCRMEFSLVGQQQVTIQVGIDAIESSVSFSETENHCRRIYHQGCRPSFT